MKVLDVLFMWIGMFYLCLVLSCCRSLFIFVIGLAVFVCVVFRIMLIVMVFLLIWFVILLVLSMNCLGVIGILCILMLK